jgi:hypothetical protein
VSFTEPEPPKIENLQFDPSEYVFTFPFATV